MFFFFGNEGYVVCPTEKRLLLLFSFLKRNRKKKIMVFFSSCLSVKFHHELFNYIDMPVMCIHVSYILSLQLNLNGLSQLIHYFRYLRASKSKPSARLRSSSSATPSRVFYSALTWQPEVWIFLRWIGSSSSTLRMIPRYLTFSFP